MLQIEWNVLEDIDKISDCVPILLWHFKRKKPYMGILRNDGDGDEFVLFEWPDEVERLVIDNYSHWSYIKSPFEKNK